MLPVIIIVLAVRIFLPNITTLEKAVQVMQDMSPLLAGLAVIAQVCSYLGSGYLLRTIARLGHGRLSILRGALITLTAASIGLVAGGWISIAAATYYWVGKTEGNAEAATLAGVLPTLYDNGVLVAVSMAGLTHLLVYHELSEPQALSYGLFLGILVLGMLLIVLGMQRQKIVEGLLIRISRFFSGLTRRPFDEEKIRTRITGFFSSTEYLRNGRWRQPIIGSGLNIGFDMITLYLLFLAAGHPASLGVLMAGYSLAFLFSRGIFAVPGGIGLIESGMIAIYANLGIPGPICVVVILSYRLLSFYLPSIMGFLAMLILKKLSFQ
jgi:hypothetical protein